MGVNLNLINLLENVLKTADGKIVYLLTLICLTMCVDFISGTIAAYINPDIEFKSKAGINGILRKISSMLLMILLVPCAVAINTAAGLTFVTTLYLGYEFMELKSIIENLDKMGCETRIFTEGIKQLFGNNKNDKKK